ncbi:MAG: UDP-N-acetylmuramoyl-L-alanine--D-glutamate ligase, partial [Patescibacteria group bacterium]|nr:UDP-N-acetylmuramoyl-L-alanine--D-glutamate ligase [Patescibacteria group bacterium]
MELKKIMQKKIVILGFGLEGLSVLKFLRSLDKEKQIIVADKKNFTDFKKSIPKIILKDKNIQFCLGKNYLDCLKSAEVIIKSPGINVAKIKEIQKAKKAGSIITSATNLFLENIKGKVIGITGTKGKSTTASLIYDILKKAKFKTYLCGNIGNPVFDYLKRDSKDSYFVIELSSYQLEDLKKAPYISIFTSFFPDHLDYHGDLEKYFKAKTNIFSRKTKAVYNAKFKKIKNFLEKNKKNILYPYNNKTNYISKDNYLTLNSKKIFSLNSLKLKGAHNKENILAAAIIAKILKIDAKIIKKAVLNFKALEHRLENIGKFKKICFYNDSASVTPESTIEAIKTLGRGNIDTIILGGLDRGYNFDGLVKNILKAEIKNIIFFKNSDKNIWKSLKKIYQKSDKKCSLPEKKQIKNMNDCVQQCFKITSPEKICLLSPASPSYLSFKNFKDRGDQFKKEV